MGRTANNLPVRHLRCNHHGLWCDAGDVDCAMTNSKTKRITLPVTKDIDLIRNRLQADTGIKMTYTQIFNFLVHFYVERANEPKSKWRSLS